MLKRLQLIIAYDGTNYHGFAKQINAVTIQEILEKAIENLTGQKVHVMASGRTDAGVHAMAQCCVVDVETSIPEGQFARALNARLPHDIVIKESCEVRADFHPRYMAKKKTYRYQIFTGATRDPFIDKYVYFYPRKLDILRMQEAAKYIEGTHDFKCFCASGSAVKDTVRTVYSLEIKREGEMIALEVCGNGFLYNMVRIITGTLIEVGRGRFEPEHVKRVIESGERELGGPTAPAEGLILKEVFYEDDLRYDIHK